MKKMKLKELSNRPEKVFILIPNTIYLIYSTNHEQKRTELVKVKRIEPSNKEWICNKYGESEVESVKHLDGDLIIYARVNGNE